MPTQVGSSTNKDLEPWLKRGIRARTQARARAQIGANAWIEVGARGGVRSRSRAETGIGVGNNCIGRANWLRLASVD